MAFLLSLLLGVYLAPLALSDLIINVQPEVISPVFTSQLMINCSVTNNQVPNIDVIKSVSLSRFNETIKDFYVLLSLDTQTFNLQQFVQFRHAQVSFGNLFLSLTVYNPVQSDAQTYRCNVDGDNSVQKNVPMKAKKEVRYEPNVTALIQEITRLKISEDIEKCSSKNVELSGYNNIRSKLHFVGSSEIVKELIEPLTVKCSFLASNDRPYEDSVLQSMYILHGKTNYTSLLQEFQKTLIPESCRGIIHKKERVEVTLASGLKVMCDTKTDGGGWIIFQRRINGKVDFYRGWKEYRDGFGDYNIGEFYLGNENIFSLTSTGQYDLRIDLELNNKKYFAQYENFKILSETEKYKLQIGDYSGNVGYELSYHNNMFFTTFDRDNDVHSGTNCAERCSGAWWYRSCHSSNLNGLWGSTSFYKGMNWYELTEWSNSVSFSEMKIRERK
ncbi:fibrinogen beta chain-like isoform X2 [Biomphalaria glabrata]|uniref:Fibrinogen beta chain-like isoform X2 n=1 Tax=Biomphalaria glabrata TaxID=6526 RepID=A0A9W2YKR3_BIOGL|nr:fibrinogen beta chain-like isoform X2 [Biomphalaria glabrata]